MPLPGIGEGFFTLTKNTIISAFLALPIVFITITAFFAATTANTGMMILLLGQILAVPTVQFGLTYLRGIGFLQRLFSLGPTLTYDNYNKLCSLSPVDVKADQLVPPVSYWLAHVLFFGTYVVSNAIAVYNATPEVSKVDPTKLENRKAQTMTSILITSLITIIMIYLHYQYVGCDTIGSLAIASIIYIPLGMSFFELAKLCGLRTADLFGIASKLYLPFAGESVYPYACVSIKK